MLHGHVIPHALARVESFVAHRSRWKDLPQSLTLHTTIKKLPSISRLLNVASTFLSHATYVSPPFATLFVRKTCDFSLDVYDRFTFINTARYTDVAKKKERKKRETNNIFQQFFTNSIRLHEVINVEFLRIIWVYKT